MKRGFLLKAHEVPHAFYAFVFSILDFLRHAPQNFGRCRFVVLTRQAQSRHVDSGQSSTLLKLHQRI